MKDMDTWMCAELSNFGGRECFTLTSDSRLFVELLQHGNPVFWGVCIGKGQSSMTAVHHLTVHTRNTASVL
jgi:hypothetical protein